MPEHTDWELMAANMLKAELKRKGVTYAQLVEKLESLGISEKEVNVRKENAMFLESVFSQVYLHALDSALRSQSKPVVLLAGGKDKELDYTDLLPRLERHVSHAIVFGEIAGKLKTLFSKAVETHQVENLTEAVKLSAKLAKRGDVVLLSPGTSSYDQFKGYEHRGDVFREAVLELR